MRHGDNLRMRTGYRTQDDSASRKGAAPINPRLNDDLLSPTPPAPHPVYIYAPPDCNLRTNHLTARWERRYSQQASATEKALLEARNAKISLREAERVLAEERSDAARAAHEAAVAAAEAAEDLREVAEARGNGLKAALT